MLIYINNGMARRRVRINDYQEIREGIQRSRRKNVDRSFKAFVKTALQRGYQRLMASPVQGVRHIAKCLTR